MPAQMFCQPAGAFVHYQPLDEHHPAQACRAVHRAPQVLQQQELEMRRLLYLARTGRAMTVWMRATLMMEDKDFDEMFPDYTNWRKQRRPPFKLTKQQRLAFQEIVNSGPPSEQPDYHR
jgi:hypothetical protein